MATSYPPFVKVPTKLEINSIPNADIRSRKYLSVSFHNSCSKKMLFILMNPSKATEFESDKTVNKCCKVAHDALKDLQIGSIDLVNLYPFYESTSKKLGITLSKIKNAYSDFYYKEIFTNLQGIHGKIENADYILMGTGGIPPEIEDKVEYRFMINSIKSFIESNKKPVFLGTSTSTYRGRYLKDGIYPYHICPSGIPSIINQIKLHHIINGEFIPIESDTMNSEFSL